MPQCFSVDNPRFINFVFRGVCINDLEMIYVNKKSGFF